MATGATRCDLARPRDVPGHRSVEVFGAHNARQSRWMAGPTGDRSDRLAQVRRLRLSPSRSSYRPRYCSLGRSMTDGSRLFAATGGTMLTAVETPNAIRMPIISATAVMWRVTVSRDHPVVGIRLRPHQLVELALNHQLLATLRVLDCEHHHHRDGRSRRVERHLPPRREPVTTPTTAQTPSRHDTVTPAEAFEDQFPSWCSRWLLRVWCGPRSAPPLSELCGRASAAEEEIGPGVSRWVRRQGRQRHGVALPGTPRSDAGRPAGVGRPRRDKGCRRADSLGECPSVDLAP